MSSYDDDARKFCNQAIKALGRFYEKHPNAPNVRKLTFAISEQGEVQIEAVHYPSFQEDSAEFFSKALDSFKGLYHRLPDAFVDMEFTFTDYSGLSNSSSSVIPYLNGQKVRNNKRFCIDRFVDYCDALGMEIHKKPEPYDFRIQRRGADNFEKVVAGNERDAFTMYLASLFARALSENPEYPADRRLNHEDFAHLAPYYLGREGEDLLVMRVSTTGQRIIDEIGKDLEAKVCEPAAPGM